jgi:hypothetical protein
MNDMLRAIADVGFPIVIAVYLLIVFGDKLDRLTDAVDRLSHFVEGLGKNENYKIHSIAPFSNGLPSK